MRKCSIGLLLTLACVPAVLAADPAPTLSPAVEQAIRNLSADDFNVREKANENLQKAFAEQLKPILKVNDEETQTRLSAFLEYQDGLTRWAIDTMKYPREKRVELASWALKAEIAPVVAKIYSAQPDVRMEGIRALGKMEGSEASTVLARLLNDDQRDVYLATMEALWDRKPTDEVIDALWARAIDAPFSVNRPRPAVAFNAANGGNAEAVLRARVAAAAIQIDYRKAQDNDAATEMLLHLKCDAGSAKLDKAIAALNKEIAGAKENGNNIMYLYMPYSEPVRNLNRLIDLYRTPDSVAYLLKGLDTDVGTRQQITVNNNKLFLSSRTHPLVTLISITGQKPEDFKLNRANNYWNLTWAAGSEAEENEAIEKVKKWFAEHKDEKLPEKETDKNAVKPGAIKTDPLPPGVVPGIKVGPAINVVGGQLIIDGVAAPMQIAPAPAVRVVAPAPAVQPVAPK